MFLQGLKLFRQYRVAYLIAVKVYDRDAHSVFYFAGSKVVQERSPLFVFFEILGDMLGKENVPGIAAIHHPLRHVDPSPGEVGPPAHVGHFAHRPAVNAHSHRNFRMLAERLGDLERASSGLFRAVMKDQGHPIAGRQPNELFVGRIADLRRPEDDFRQLAEALLLFLDQELGVTDEVDEEDMPDFKAELVVWFRCHSISSLLLLSPFAEFLEARIIPNRIEHRIEPKQRGSQRGRSQCTIGRY